MNANIDEMVRDVLESTIDLIEDGFDSETALMESIDNYMPGNYIERYNLLVSEMSTYELHGARTFEEAVVAVITEYVRHAIVMSNEYVEAVNMAEGADG